MGIMGTHFTHVMHMFPVYTIFIRQNDHLLREPRILPVT